MWRFVEVAILILSKCSANTNRISKKRAIHTRTKAMWYILVAPLYRLSFHISRIWMFGFRYHSNRNRGKCHAYDDGWIRNHRQHNNTFGLLCCHRTWSPRETLSRNPWNERKICKQTKQVFSPFATQYWSKCLVVVVLLTCYPIDHFKGWGCGGTPLKPNI